MERTRHPRVRIELTPAQKEQAAQATSKDRSALELTAGARALCLTLEELEERTAPGVTYTGAG